MIKSALLCLALSVFYESRCEPIEWQYAIAEVVLNRASDRNLSVCEVIYEKINFKMLANGKFQMKIIRIGKSLY